MTLHTEDRRSLRVKVESKDCELPRDELSRMQELLDQIDEAVGELPADLEFTIVRHPNIDRYHADAALRLPRRTLFTGDWDVYLDLAISRCLRKLISKIEAYQREPDHAAETVAERLDAMNREIIAPEDPQAGPIAAAAAARDYQTFRELLADYDDWLRLRFGRWIQRYPAADAAVGMRFEIADLVDEVYLNAFERYDERPNNSTLSEWLEELFDPSIQMFLRHAERERENIEADPYAA